MLDQPIVGEKRPCARPGFEEMWDGERWVPICLTCGDEAAYCDGTRHAVPSPATSAPDLDAIRAEHVYPSYASTSDEAWQRNPVCSCGRADCPAVTLLAALAAATPTVSEAVEAVQRLSDQAIHTAGDAVGRDRARSDREIVLAALGVAVTTDGGEG